MKFAARIARWVCRTWLLLDVPHGLPLAEAIGFAAPATPTMCCTVFRATCRSTALLPLLLLCATLLDYCYCCCAVLVTVPSGSPPVYSNVRPTLIRRSTLVYSLSDRGALQHSLDARQDRAGGGIGANSGWED
jgi:hypothetical protein